MKLEVKSLRSRSFYDYFLIAIKFMTWLIAILILIYTFLALLLGALKSPAAFGHTVLILALITIALVFILILLNVAQKIIFDRMEQRQQKKLEQANRLIDRFKLDTNTKFNHSAFKSFLKHLSTLEIAAEHRLTEDENQDLSLILIKIGAENILEKQARSSRRKWRQIQALYLLGWLRPEQKLRLLNEALYDPDIGIISAAVGALSKYSADSAYQLLLEALNNGRLPYSRLASFIEFSNCKNKLPWLARQTQASNPKVRFWIAYLVGRTDSSEALTVLASLLKDTDANVRAGATEALGKLGDKHGLALLKPLFKDSEWPVRLHAAKAAGELDAKELIPDLIRLLRDKQWWVRENSAQSLNHFGQAAWPYLKILLNNDDRFSRNKAAEILGRQGVVTEWINKLTAAPTEVDEAHDFLVTVGRAEAINIIEDAVINSKPVIALKLIEILGEIDNPGTKTTLKHLADGKFDKQVRAKAVETLKMLKGAA